MNWNERADNISKRKVTDYFKPGNNKSVRNNVDNTVQIEPIIEITTSQDKEAVTIEEDKPFNRSDDFCFPKRKFGENNVLARPIGSDNSNGCITMSSKWI